MLRTASKRHSRWSWSPKKMTSPAAWQSGCCGTTFSLRGQRAMRAVSALRCTRIFTVHTSDVVIAGAGIIGLSLAMELRRAGATVTVLDRGEPGREASSAAAGMLVTSDPDTSAPLLPLAQASAVMYPVFVEEIELRSGVKVELENRGALYVAEKNERFSTPPVSVEDLRR